MKQRRIPLLFLSFLSIVCGQIEQFDDSLVIKQNITQIHSQVDDDFVATIKRHYSQAEHIEKLEVESLNETISKLIKSDEIIEKMEKIKNYYDEWEYQSSKGKGRLQLGKGKGNSVKSPKSYKCAKGSRKSSKKYSVGPSPSPTSSNAPQMLRSKGKGKGTSKGKGKGSDDCETETPSDSPSLAPTIGGLNNTDVPSVIPSSAPTLRFNITNCDSYYNVWYVLFENQRFIFTEF